MGCSKGRLQLPDDVLDNTKHIPIIFLKACVPLPTFFTHFPFLAGFILTDHAAPLSCSASKLLTAQSLKENSGATPQFEDISRVRGRWVCSDMTGYTIEVGSGQTI